MNKILIADDNLDLSEAIRVRLEAENYKVFIACDGKQAIDIAEKEKPDLIILDVLMPAVDGFEVCKRIKSDREKGYLPIIMLTVRDQHEEKVKGLDLGAHDYITKPYETDELLARIRSGLRAKKEFDTLLKMVERDDLTGLYNRRSLDRRLKQEFARAQRYTRELSLIMLDIDRFKAVNDTYGHQMGDTVLKQIVGLIESAARRADIPHRYGGEEFVVVAPETGVSGAKKCAERIRLSCQAKSFGKKGEPISLTISGGVSSYPWSTASTPEELLREADAALYKAKAAGGNAISIFEDNEQK